MNFSPNLHVLLTEVIAPVLKALLTAEELEHADLVLAPDSGDRNDERGWWRLALKVEGEAFLANVFQTPSMDDWSTTQMSEKLASDLQDFIAESRFGWGQQRLYSLPGVQPGAPHYDLRSDEGDGA